jgi:hypothetical protein
VNYPIHPAADEVIQIVDSLTFCSYRAQRYEFPDVTPERWGQLACFRNWRELEAMFQQEKAEYEATTMKQLDSWIVGRGASA